MNTKSASNSPKNNGKNWNRFFLNQSDLRRAAKSPLPIGLASKASLALAKRGKIQRHAETFSVRKHMLAATPIMARKWRFAPYLAKNPCFIGQKRPLEMGRGVFPKTQCRWYVFTLKQSFCRPKVEGGEKVGKTKKGSD